MPLHPAAEYAAPPAAPEPEASRTGPLLLELLAAVSESFGQAPTLLRSGGGRALLLLYRDAACRWEDLTGPWGEAVAAVSRVWPLALCGMAPTGEMEEVTAERAEGRVAIRLRTASGRPFEDLEGLCLRLEAETAGDGGHLSALCAAFGQEGWSAALGRRHEDFLRRWGLLRPTPGSLFCYLDGAARPEELVRALSAGRKEQLWSAFLRDGVQPVEFEWLWAAYRCGRASHLLEWDLTLETVLESVGDTGAAGAAGAAWARRFDFVRGGAAEKLFLKLLFPAEYRGGPSG